MTDPASRSRLALVGGTALLALAACDTNGGFDLDFRRFGNGGFSTTAAAREAVQARPDPDSHGIITYPNYQVVIASHGDTPTTIARRIGVDPGQLARYNAIAPGTSLNAGEVLAIPGGVDAGTGGQPDATATNPGALTSGTIDITSLASRAIDNAQANKRTSPSSPPATTSHAPPAFGPEPIRHKVQRGETAYSIARYYNVPVRSLAEWNGLPNDMSVREGQILLIPVASARRPGQTETTTTTTAPGTRSPTPEPPSAARPLPAKVPPRASAPVDTSSVPDMSNERTTASNTSRMGMPVSGAIIRQFKKGKNDGIDISASVGSPVKAAASGTVLLISKDTDDVSFLAIKHTNNLVTVYYNVTGITVKKGTSVSRGQTIARIAPGEPGYLHFEVRKGIVSIDPMPYLN